MGFTEVMTHPERLYMELPSGPYKPETTVVFSELPPPVRWDFPHHPVVFSVVFPKTGSFPPYQSNYKPKNAWTGHT